MVDAASDEVVFPGAIYDPEVVQALRFHSLAYVHGHTVGGTNPSLVEAMAAGNPVIAHDNVYNRWVAGPAQRYFTHGRRPRRPVRRCPDKPCTSSTKCTTRPGRVMRKSSRGSTSRASTKRSSHVSMQGSCAAPEGALPVGRSERSGTEACGG